MCCVREVLGAQTAARKFEGALQRAVKMSVRPVIYSSATMQVGLTVNSLLCRHFLLCLL